MRTCYKCKEQKELSQFKTDKSRKSGHGFICKQCDSAVRTFHFYANHEATLKQHQTYYQKNRAAWNEKTLLYRGRHREKYKAGLAVRNAIKAGKLTRMPCAVCKSPKSHGHHPDYSKQLEVIWLCATHHMEQHRKAARRGDKV